MGSKRIDSLDGGGRWDGRMGRFYGETPTPAGSSADDVLLIDDTEDTDEWLVSPS